ncbi:MAG: hypothetical protein JWN48_5315 [Myxococcaceae bacterium]|nr:hypothetical protein [Myxococcaceae bacterium]
MAAVRSVQVDPGTVRAFASQAAFERWLETHHDKERELYLRLYKKGSGVTSISYREALDVALCWGWIDGLKKSYDERSFLQRFTPRKAKSIWSQINREHVARLIAAGRMTEHGLAQVEAAKADGRWHAAYASPSAMTLPDDLRQAIEQSAPARRTYEQLDKANRYALAFRLGNLKTPAARAKKIETFVAMLARGESLHPAQQRARASKRPPQEQAKAAKKPAKKTPAKKTESKR